MPDTIRTFDELAAYFELGDKPTAQQFRDMLYTMFNGGVVPPLTKQYRALISEETAATITTGTVPIGSIWTVTTYVAGDDFSNWELLSGTENTTGAVYRALTTAPTDYSNGSTLDYDGAPFIVSTDADGDFNPFINTLGGSPVIIRSAGGIYKATLTGAFPKGKTIARLGLNKFHTYGATDTVFGAPNDIYFYSDNSSGASADNVLQYAEIEIIVFP